ncbi:MAG TPA: LacI family DNA-binding transcriptional regulator [Chloroflexota bacterium]
MEEGRAATIQDVASLAGVSISTVSRVVNDAGYPIRPETRRRVIEAVAALGFRPNPIARSLLGKPTLTIGLIVPDITNPYYPLLSRGVEDVASEHGYTVIFCNTDRSASKARHYMEVLREKQTDGFIFAGGGVEEGDEPILTERDAGRVVLIGRHRWDFPSVQVDNVRAGYEATSHLIGLGHRRIGFISGPANLTSSRDRATGYRRAMRELGVTSVASLIREGDFQSESGYSAATSLLGDAGRPTAIFAANDRMAIAAIAAAYDLGLSVPDDVAVVGFDDTPAARYVRPALTTVALPSYEIGSTAARLLLRLLAGETTEQTVCLTTRLVVRQSSGMPLRG